LRDIGPPIVQWIVLGTQDVTYETAGFDIVVKGLKLCHVQSFPEARRLNKLKLESSSTPATDRAEFYTAVALPPGTQAPGTKPLLEGEATGASPPSLGQVLRAKRLRTERDAQCRETRKSAFGNL